MPCASLSGGLSQGRHFHVFVRGKTPDESILKLAKARDIVVMRSPRRMYDACGLIYLNGLRGD